MMPTVIQDKDAIVARALEIGSAPEREAFLARACGDDVALRRQVEEQLAAHSQAHNGSPAHPAPHHGPATAPIPEASGRQKYPRFVTAAALLMVAGACAGAGLAVWGVRERGKAQQAMREAEELRQRSLKVEEDFKRQRDQAEAARQAADRERDREVERGKAERDTVEDMKAVLGFFQRRVLSAGRPMGWAGGQGKEVSLRKAVDQAEARVDEGFADRPLAEAALRETLGATYLDLEAPAQAVKEFERALALREALQGQENADTVACRNQLANAYRQADRALDASRLYEPGNVTLTHASALAIRGEKLLARQKFTEAAEKLRECLAIRQKLRPDDCSTFEAKAMLRRALMRQKKDAEAEPLLASGCEGLKRQQEKLSPRQKRRYVEALRALVQLYDAEKQKDKAAPWRKELRAVEASTKPAPSGARVPQ